MNLTILKTTRRCSEHYRPAAAGTQGMIELNSERIPRGLPRGGFNSTLSTCRVGGEFILYYIKFKIKYIGVTVCCPILDYFTRIPISCTASFSIAVPCLGYYYLLRSPL